MLIHYIHMDLVVVIAPPATPLVAPPIAPPPAPLVTPSSLERIEVIEVSSESHPTMGSSSSPSDDSTKTFHFSMPNSDDELAWF